MLFPAGSRDPFSVDQACKQQNGLLSATQTMPPARDATWLPKVPDAKVMETRNLSSTTFPVDANQLGNSRTKR